MLPKPGLDAHPNVLRVRRGVAVALISAIACRHRGLPPAVQVPPGIGTSRQVQLAGGRIDVRLDVPSAPAGPKPAIISSLTERDALLTAGAVLVTYHINWTLVPSTVAGPAPPAGQPVGSWLLAAPTPERIGEGFFRQVSYSAGEAVPTVVDYLLTVPEVDSRRIGIASSSTNGFTALQAVATDSRIAVAVVVAACADYRCFLQQSNMGMDGRPLNLDAVYGTWLRNQEPVRHPERMVHAALLLVNGADDQVVPAACARESARVLERAYTRAGVPERFRFAFIEGEGHVLGDAAAHEVRAWLERWLLAGRSD